MDEPATPYYDDPEFSYPAFWQGRSYEHTAELAALSALIGERTFDIAADIGGGFGRISSFLSQAARAVVLVEPSGVQRALASEHLPPSVHIMEGSAARTGLPDASCDLAVMVRVLHHLPEPEPAFAEMRRILKPGGIFVLEFANSQHAKAKLQRALAFERASLAPVPVNDGSDSGVPFVNHHPRTIYAALIRQGFVIDDVLSVSNLRSPLLKRVIPESMLLALESGLQRPLGRIHFGPSVFVRARRI